MNEYFMTYINILVTANLIAFCIYDLTGILLRVVFDKYRRYQIHRQYVNMVRNDFMKGDKL